MELHYFIGPTTGGYYYKIDKLLYPVAGRHTKDLMQVTYSSKLYLGFILAVLAAFLFTNGATLIGGRLIALIPVAAHLAVAVALLIKSKYVKWFVKGWALLFIVSFGLQLLAQILFLLSDATDKINYNTIVKSLLMCTIGVIIFVFADKTIILGKEISKIEEKDV